MSLEQESQKQIHTMCVKIKRCRMEKGDSILEVSQRTRIPHTALEHLEQGVFDEIITLDDFIRLCGYFGKTPAELFR